MKVIQVHIVQYNEKYCKVYQCQNSVYFLEQHIGNSTVIKKLSEVEKSKLGL